MTPRLQQRHHSAARCLLLNLESDHLSGDLTDTTSGAFGVVFNNGLSEEDFESAVSQFTSPVPEPSALSLYCKNSMIFDFPEIIMKYSIAFLSLVLAFGPSTAFSHDLWLVPSENTVKVGDRVDLVIAVGMDFPVSLNAITPSRVTVTAGNSKLEGRRLELKQDEPSKCTVASFMADSPGSWLVSCVTEPNQLDMKAADFNDYLLHDGLPQILAQRMDTGKLDQDAREQYSKYTKALLQVGRGESNQIEGKVLGLKLEIVLLDNPFDKKPGETLTAQVLFEGKPLEHANLCWDHPGNGEAFSGQTWTDSSGKAMVPIARPGLTTLRLVHMTHPDAEDHEWESFWSSFTFRIPEPVSPGPDQDSTAD